MAILFCCQPALSDCYFWAANKIWLFWFSWKQWSLYSTGSQQISIAAIWSENSDFGQNSDQNHGKCSFGQKKVRILDSSQKFWKIGQNAGKSTIFFEKIKFWQEKTYFQVVFTKISPAISGDICDLKNYGYLSHKLSINI